MDPSVELAVAAIRAYATTGKKIKTPENLDESMGVRAGVFVSIKKHGELRGCIGTIQPTTDNLAQEIISNAISAASRDPRFPPIEAEELGDLTVSVDVLSPPEPVDDISALDAKKYGVIVQAGLKRGLLLPDLDGVDTPEEQIAICQRKGGIRPDETVQLFRFLVTRHT